MQRRRVVVHHAHLLKDQICQLLKPKDLVFFDDCLFSQYVFIKDNLQKLKALEVNCILGFSSGLYASEDAEQTYAVESHVLHNACNRCIKTLEDANRLRSSLYEMKGFMKVSQLKELLSLDFCQLALHGCCHLDLQHQRSSVLQKMVLFKQDLDDGCQQLAELGLCTSMYVYPYIYSLLASDSLLRQCGFTKIVGSQADSLRCSIEDLERGQEIADS